MKGFQSPRLWLWLLPAALIAVLALLLPQMRWRPLDDPIQFAYVHTEAETQVYADPDALDGLLRAIDQGASWRCTEPDADELPRCQLDLLRPDGHHLWLNVYSHAVQLSSTARPLSPVRTYRFRSIALEAFLAASVPSFSCASEGLPKPRREGLCAVFLALQPKMKDPVLFKPLPRSEWDAVCNALDQAADAVGAQDHFNMLGAKAYLRLEYDEGAYALIYQYCPSLLGDCVTCRDDPYVLRRQGQLIKDVHPVEAWIPADWAFAE